MLSPRISALVSPPINSRPDQKRLRQPIRARLHRIADLEAPVPPVAQQFRKSPRILRRRDDQNLPQPRQHQRAQRVINHRLVVDRQKLLRHHMGHGIKPRPRSARKNNALHIVPPAPRSSSRSSRDKRPSAHCPPTRMLQIPAHRFAQPALKLLCRLPAQLPGNLARVDRIPPVVPRPVLHR